MRAAVKMPSVSWHKMCFDKNNYNHNFTRLRMKIRAFTALAMGALLGLTGCTAKPALQDPAVYAVFTGIMTALTQLLLAIGILLLVIGFALWGSNVFFGRSHRKNA